MATYRYVRSSGVRKLVKDNDKRCGADFLNELDRFIYETVCRCLNVWNGSKKTLDRSVIKHITGQKIKEHKTMTKNKEIAKIEETSKMPSQMIQLAIDKGADLDKLEKLLTLQERYEANQARKAYHEAMAQFKVNPPKIDKDKKVSFGQGKTTYNHASLYNVTDKINSELSKYGLSVSWKTQQNGKVIVTCKITHIQGHSEETSLSADADTSGSKNSIQAIGSTITYLERYTLLALTGLATFDQDDDGKSVTIEAIDEKQLGSILDYINEKNVNMERFCKAFGITKVEDLPKTRFDEAIKALQAKKVSK